MVVLIKYTPDLTGERRFTADHTVDREDIQGNLSELDEYAAEQALRIQESADGWDITYLTMGPPAAAEALRRALAMGGQDAVHVADNALHGSDVMATSMVIATALRQIGYDLVIAGMASTDGGMGVLPALIAEHLSVPQITLAGRITVTDGTVEVVRESDSASETLTAPLPTVASVTDQSGDARYPSFKGIMSAKKKPVLVLSLADLGIAPSDVGLAAAKTTVLAITPRPARTAGQLVKDDGDGGRALADFLAAQKFI
jgi:electron transfer flavoprotein beta subunit